MISELLRDEEAVTTVEYAILLSTIVVVSVSAWVHLGEGIRNAVNEAASVIEGGASTTG